MNEEFDTRFYKLHVVDGRVSLNFKDMDYQFTNLDDINLSLGKVSEKYDMEPINNFTIQHMISDFNEVFEYQFNIGNIFMKMNPISDDIVKISSDYLARNKEKAYNLGIERLIKRIEVDFNITNEHDQKLIVNKLSNQYKKHNGNIFDIRACYTNGDDTPDALFSYIKKYQRESGVYEQLLYNDVTKSHILIGFGYPDYLR